MPKLSEKILNLAESETLRISALAKNMKAQGIDVVSLSAGEPDFPTPEHVKEAAIQAIKENFTKYTQNQGIPELINAIIEKFRRDNNIEYKPTEILVSNGAKHSIFNALQAICNPGDEVIIPAPYWVSYPSMVALVDAKPVILKTDIRSSFKITPEQLKETITEKTKALIFNSPSNPTGTVYTEDEIRKIAEVVYEKNIFVISDEIYEKIIYEGKHFSMASIKELKNLVITINGVSKAYAMTGWRIGYLGASEEIVKLANKVQGQMTSNASSISQKAALAALTGPQEPVRKMVNEFKIRRDFLCSELKQIPGIEVFVPSGAFYVFPKVSAYYGRSYNGMVIKNSNDFCEFLLKEEKLAIIPGDAFGMDEYVRISYAASMEELMKGVERFRRAIEKLSD
ncbi:aspartate aminotransferase [Candidatus Kryptonium thompsonii]|jgi:aspartate aminotransferase|uniref:Aminotransferase n=4 Tax=Candidatus Kryptonium thompsonii TaxID=1633631 RepID=A0A0P1N013_9BACT|nr:pyridoxal phosphate-dependent aminotransferase [Candidatus Kryptonium thompsoni]CUS82402.1 aspartate aminotransferase [Candidatus Kryptonium thompsoni]CUS82795.1 aspartate aminotransferase [Candidatus Kryptonium thompsoni]CUS83168.1 aspartate aminotransferase [Candidatus Kryptonium thompsoni]CUS88160.1 aspartate aminotransferase [Candidatus Kryptonium thompsoni]CUS90798.1 aspartate aminotransferase [Candidatus Kryptonium thompsoni]